MVVFIEPIIIFKVLKDPRYLFTSKVISKMFVNLPRARTIIDSPSTWRKAQILSKLARIIPF